MRIPAEERAGRRGLVPALAPRGPSQRPGRRVEGAAGSGPPAGPGFSPEPHTVALVAACRSRRPGFPGGTGPHEGPRCHPGAEAPRALRLTVSGPARRFPASALSAGFAAPPGLVPSAPVGTVSPAPLPAPLVGGCWSASRRAPLGTSARPATRSWHPGRGSMAPTRPSAARLLLWRRDSIRSFFTLRGRKRM